MNSKKILVSVIIVNYNTKKLVSDCLTSIFSKTEGVGFEVIVVDNASTESLECLISDHFPQVVLIESKVNLGFGKANNLAASKANGDYLFFLNSDTVLINNAIKILSDYLLSHDDTGICGGNLYNADLLPATSFSQIMPSVFSEIDYFFFHVFSRFKHGRNLNFNFTNHPMCVGGFISGADLMMKKEVFSQIKGFDPDFFMYYEETELTYRVKRLGLKVVSVPAARILHLEGASEVVKEASALRSFKSKFLYYHKTGMSRMIFLSHICFALTAFQRMLIFLCLRKIEKYQLWLKLLELERKTFKSLPRR